MRDNFFSLTNFMTFPCQQERIELLKPKFVRRNPINEEKLEMDDMKGSSTGKCNSCVCFTYAFLYFVSSRGKM